MTLAIRLRSRRLATLAAATLILAVTPLITSATASASVAHPTLNCQPESFPLPGTPRNSAGKPYEAQFAATLNGGYLSIHVPGHVGVTFGALQPPLYPSGTLFGEACGLVNLPSLKGPIADPQPGAPDGNPAYNHNFILHGPAPNCVFRYASATDMQPTRGTQCDQQDGQAIPVPVSLDLPAGGGITGLFGYGSADGIINAAIISPAATNGGFNVAFTNTAKATAVLNPAAVLTMLGGIPVLGQLGLSAADVATLTTLLGIPSPPGGECTLAVGDLSQTGLPGAPATSPVNLRTDTGLGKPVTGPASAGTQPITPATAGSAVAYANDFDAPAIDPNMPPDPGAPNANMSPSSLCLPAVADLFNVVLGLPAPPGDVTFDAPVGFSAHAAQ